jgi:2-hydroxy-6-oxo-octa-2,4-dienoate hydrolase
MHAMLPVADIAASLGFYRMLGMEVQVDRSDPVAGRRNLFLGGGCEAEHALIELADHLPPLPTNGHIAVECFDVIATCNRLDLAGYRVTRPPRKLASGSIIAFAADPDGHMVELVQMAGSGIRRYNVMAAGLRFNLLDAGSGPPLLMLHGGGSRAEHFAEMAALLADRFRVIAYDQRGFAQTGAADPQPVDHDHWASDVPAVMDALGIAHAALLGWSMGATVAINAAARFPDRITAIVLVGGADPDRPVDVARLEARLHAREAMSVAQAAAQDRAELGNMVAPVARARPGLLDGLVADRAASGADLQRRAIAGYATRPNLNAALAQIGCPAHVVSGTADPMFTPEVADRLVGKLPGATYDLMADCGHYYAAEQPRNLADVVIGRLMPQETPPTATQPGAGI